MAIGGNPALRSRWSLPVSPDPGTFHAPQEDWERALLGIGANYLTLIHQHPSTQHVLSREPTALQIGDIERSRGSTAIDSA
jgi:hypothetical protein